MKNRATKIGGQLLPVNMRHTGEVSSLTSAERLRWLGHPATALTTHQPQGQKNTVEVLERELKAAP